jgi:putative salt-induced outer membrane protein YdiY
MNNNLKLTSALLMVVCTSNMLAGEPAQSINFGLSNTSGNTKTQNIDAKYTFANELKGDKPLKYNLEINYFKASTEGVTTSEERSVALKTTKEISGDIFAYADLDCMKNKFKNYDRKSSLGVGLGTTLMSDDTQKLIVKAGLAYNNENFYNDQKNKSFGSLNEALEYTNQLNKTSKGYVNLSAMENLDDMSKDYEAKLVAGLDFAVKSNINVVIEESIDYDKLPATGFKKTDTKTIVRVGYKF